MVEYRNNIQPFIIITLEVRVVLVLDHVGYTPLQFDRIRIKSSQSSVHERLERRTECLELRAGFF